ncbi:hypothetical protein K2X14_08080 [Acetobacter sp. TBRC 12305]|uniref:Uncharacterized protein n=1 Tax=Acetobacter garciniae TaxID=2817435 RepID=A0A939KME4_9PROT|nr:hypothetical protein [Acetobacter garciniae]MBO1325238.1 hypothetical protein [Acetobacter garciniae]MBX0344790.1 hypothetical protein [Acetobacter garciniae]
MTRPAPAAPFPAAALRLPGNTPGGQKGHGAPQAGAAAGDDGVHVPVLTGRVLLVMQGALLAFIGLWAWLGWSIPR